MCQVTWCLLSTIEHMIDHQHDKYLSESEADKKRAPCHCKGIWFNFYNTNSPKYVIKY